MALGIRPAFIQENRLIHDLCTAITSPYTSSATTLGQAGRTDGSSRRFRRFGAVKRHFMGTFPAQNKGSDASEGQAPFA